MSTPKAELVTRAMRLHQELAKIRAQAQSLPVGDMMRWRLSLRAEKIGQQLRRIHEANEQKSAQ